MKINLIVLFTMISVLIFNSALQALNRENRFKIEKNSFELIIDDNEGLELKSDEELFIIIPDEFRKRTLNYVRVYFRKAPALLSKKDKKWDENGAYLSFYFHDSEKDRWIRWHDEFGFEKFATLGDSKNYNKNIFQNCRRFTENKKIDGYRLLNKGRGDKSLAKCRIHLLKFVYLEKYDTNNFSYSKILNNPEKIDSTRIKYILNEQTGVEIRQKETWKLNIPEVYHRKTINQIIIRHRKKKEYMISEGEWDDNPAYILVSIHDKNKNFLFPWYDRFGSEKFSEIRSSDDPETDNLHDCLNITDKINNDFILLSNKGKGDPDYSIANIHDIQIVFHPEINDYFIIEKIFSEGTIFTDIKNNKFIPEFGGGPRFEGRYPGSLLIGTGWKFRKNKIFLLPEKYFYKTAEDHSDDYYVDELGKLHIKLLRDKKFVNLEIAAGDVDITNMKINKDRHFGRLGWSELYFYLKSGDRKTLLLEKENVGPVGVFSLSPVNDHYRTGKNDEIIIESRIDVANIMGYRIKYLK